MAKDDPPARVRTQARSWQKGAAKSALARAGRPGAAHHRGHPCGSDRPYSDEETAFLAAVEAHRLAVGRRFLLATDYLDVLKALGYRRMDGAGDAR